MTVLMEMAKEDAPFSGELKNSLITKYDKDYVYKIFTVKSMTER